MYDARLIVAFSCGFVLGVVGSNALHAFQSMGVSVRYELLEQ